jgi:hypothetical protein
LRTFEVEVTAKATVIFIVEAGSPEEARRLVFDGAGDPDDFDLIDIISVGKARRV